MKGLTPVGPFLFIFKFCHFHMGQKLKMYCLKLYGWHALMRVTGGFFLRKTMC